MSKKTNVDFDYMNGTTANEVIQYFHSSFADKHVIPDSLELIWLKRAIVRYSLELEELNFDDETQKFSQKLNPTAIDTLALYMKKFYQERELSKANKRISIVGKDVSINSGMSSSKFLESELDNIELDIEKNIYNSTPSAYN